MRAFILSAVLVPLALAIPNLSVPRDEFAPCTSFGSRCAKHDIPFCDATTGKQSICHPVGNDCWIEYTELHCDSKRSPAGFPEHGKSEEGIEQRDPAGYPEHGKTGNQKRAPAGTPDDTEQSYTVQKREEIMKCSDFGDGCKAVGYDFCYEGKTAFCHEVPLSDDCLIQFTEELC